ncbi:adenylosuccinate synthase [bacterium]|nr:adenylosuccinate synthase [bacterium]
MAIDVLLGLQWGDEGKGKIVDVLSGRYDLIARFQGGPNAGHTLEFDGAKHVLHTIPSGIFHRNALNLIGNGVVIDPVIFLGEIEKLRVVDDRITDRLYISRKAHLILPTHRLLDAASEAAKGKDKIGSTLKGIGPTYMDKTGRNGLRVGDLELRDFPERYRSLVDKHLSLLRQYPDFQFDLPPLEAVWMEASERLRGMQLVDSELYLSKALAENKRVLAEGAQGSLLDIDFGTYPFVTSSTTTAAGACTGLGVAPNRIGQVFGIFKAYCTRVGSGPFPTELDDELGEKLRKNGREFGSTTGRPRRCGWLDLPALKYAIEINGVSELMMMKADVLGDFDRIGVCTAYRYNGKEVTHLPYRIDPELVEPVYTWMPGWNCDLSGIERTEDLPEELMNYVRFIERETGIRIGVLSVGPDRRQTLSLS